MRRELPGVRVLGLLMTGRFADAMGVVALAIPPPPILGGLPLTPADALDALALGLLALLALTEGRIAATGVFLGRFLGPVPLALGTVPS